MGSRQLGAKPTRADDAARYVDALGAATYRNLLFNSSLLINKRDYTFNALAAGAYGLDRWKAGAGGLTLQNGGASGPERVVVISAGTMIQIVEGTFLAGGSYVLSWEGTATARIAINGAALSGAFSASPLRINGANVTTNITIEFSTGSLARPQFESGAIVTPYDRRPPPLEDALCSRYFQYCPSWPGTWMDTDATKATITGAFFYPMRLGPNYEYKQGRVVQPGLQFVNVTGVSGAALDNAGGYIDLTTANSGAAGRFCALVTGSRIHLSAEL